MTGLPQYYFRIRENGAAVFRVDTENRQRRIDMDQIAVVNIRNGEVRAQGDRTLSSEDTEAIEAWMEDVLQVPVSRGYLAKLCTGTISASLADAYDELTEAIPRQEHLGSDETSPIPRLGVLQCLD